MTLTGNRNGCPQFPRNFLYGTSIKTYRISTRAYTSLPTDELANIAYLDVVAEMPTWLDRRDENSAVGDIVITNDGQFSDWFNYAWQGHKITLSLGDISWPRDDFYTVKSAVIEDLTSPNEYQYVLSLKDKGYVLDTPVSTVLENGKLIPVAMGQVQNATPILIDAVTRKYRGSDHGHISGPSAFPDVRDNGNTVIFDDSANDGTYTLATQAYGELTHDYDDGLHTASQMIGWLLNRKGLAAQEYDTTYASTAILQKLITGDDSYNDVIKDIMDTVGGKHRFGRDGVLRLKRTKVAGNDPVDVIIDGNNINKSGGIEHVTSDQPVKAVKLAYKINNTVQNPATLDGGLVGTLTDDERDLYSSEYQLVEAVNVDIENQWPLAENEKIRLTLFVNKTDAQAEADYVAALHSVRRDYFDINGFLTPYAVSIDDEVTVEDDSYNFAAGQNLVVIEMDEDEDEQIRLQGWR